MKQAGAHVVHIATFMPDKIVRNDTLKHAIKDDPLLENEFFKAPQERRFAYPELSAADLGTKALECLWRESGISPESVDFIIYSTSITDYVNIGIGPDIQYRSKATKAKVLSIDTGCVSFLTMLNLADTLLISERYRRIVLVTVTNFVSRLKDFQKSPRSWVLGDGATATLIEKGTSCILSSNEDFYGENYGLMVCRPRGPNNEPQNYWETNSGVLQVEFNEAMVDRLKSNAINLVSESVKKSISDAGLTNSDISFLLTHQPNIALIAKWREHIGIHPPRAFDTFQKYGNLFQGSIPTTMSDGIKSNTIKRGDIIALGTFSNGGDIVSSAVIKF